MFGATNANAYEITNFSAQITNQDGTFASQAGGHPFQGVIAFDTKKVAGGNNEGQTKTIRVDTPPGLVPNPESVPMCEQEQLEDNACPSASQIGTTQLRLSRVLSDGGAPGSAGNPFGLPAGFRGDLVLLVSLYNMVPNEGQLARFSFNPTQPGGAATGHIVDVEGAMRRSDNGLYFTINDVTRPTPEEPGNPTLTGSTLTFWGAPGAASHDAQRGASRLTLVSVNGGNPVPAPILTARPGGVLGGTAPTGAAGISDRDTAFLAGPTVCNGPQKALLTLDSYAGERRTAEDIVGEETNGATGCDQVPFSSSTTFGPSSMQNDAPVPLSVALDVPQTSDVNTLATSHVDDVSVTLPPGMTISPSAANGLEACTDEQFGQGSEGAIACPASSRVGSTTLTTPVLGNPLEGSVFIGQPLSGNRYRLFVSADGYGASIRLKGTVTPNPETGQVTAVFENNPELPFSQFKLDFDGGSKAIIASAQTCGTTEGSGTLTAYSGAPASRTASTVQTTGCNGNPFAPTLGATSVSTLAGKYSPIGVTFGRPDGNQFLSGLSAKLPIGMTAKIKGVRQCSEAQVAAIACPTDSRIATVSVAAGPGEAPYRLSGSAYLTGSYKGGAFGSVAVIRVIAGPYDLGHVVVRQALRVDPETAQVTVDSDPLPQIKEGIVLRLRELKLDVDRRDFLRNPTSCGPAILQADLTGAAGGKSTQGARQTFTDCQKLPFRPKISVAFGVKSQMKKGRNPSVTVTATQRESEAGIRSTQVALPKDVSLKAANAETLCTQEQMRADKCPKASIVGSAKATTTILNRSLSGPVYFVRGQRTTAAGKVVRTLPALYIPLFGEARINVRAQTSVSRGRLVTTLPAIPDAPITKFTLKINGGKRGIINANRDLCQRSVKASARFISWNGKKAPTRKPRISRSVCKTSSK
jgi:hypothetical protein